MDMTPQDYVGRTLLVTCRALRLPTGRDVLEGETFKFLQVHLDKGCRPDLWIATGNAELAPDTPQRVPTGGKPTGAADASTTTSAAPVTVTVTATTAEAPKPAAAVGGGKG